MTQEFISNMLGVRREGVTQAAPKLQQPGVISYTHGLPAVGRAGVRLQSSASSIIPRPTMPPPQMALVASGWE